MGQRRENRGLKPRTDQQILAHTEDMNLLTAIAAGRLMSQDIDRMDRVRLDDEDLILAAGAGQPTLLPRARRLLEAWTGQSPVPMTE